MLSNGVPHEQYDEPVVLVTVFGPFPGQVDNPTEAIADELAGEEHVVCHVLDVSYVRSPQQVDELVAMLDPAAVVAFGVAATAERVRVETIARNRADAAEPDVDGVVHLERTIDDGPPERATRLPVDAIVDALDAATIPVERSADAGSYVCNVLFHHLLTAPALAGRPVGFVHVPDPGVTPSFDLGAVTVTGRIVVDTVAAYARGDIRS